MKCAKCNGTGKGKCASVHYENGVRKEQSFEITCFSCTGTGEVTAARVAQLKRMDEMWCRCGNPSGETTYHPDSPRAKHHWTCNECGKITQVG